jgi:Myosin tail
VTNNEEKLVQKENELKHVADRLDKLKSDHDELELKHRQVIEEKLTLAERLQAEMEAAAEAEEVIHLSSCLRITVIRYRGTFF